MSDGQDIAVPGTKRWVKVLLAVSLALNFAFVGLIAGAVIRTGGPEAAKRAPALGAFGAPYMMALPKSERREVFRLMRKDRQDNWPDRRARREMVQDVLSSLRASPFDPTTLEAAVTRQSDSTVQMLDRAQSAWLERVSAMTDADRSRYADKIEDVLRRGPKNRRQ